MIKDNIGTIDSAVLKIQNIISGSNIDSNLRFKSILTKNFLEMLKNNVDEYEINTPYTLDGMGRKAFDILKNIGGSFQDEIDFLIIFLTRCAREKVIRSGVMVSGVEADILKLSSVGNSPGQGVLNSEQILDSVMFRDYLLLNIIKKESKEYNAEKQELFNFIKNGETSIKNTIHQWNGKISDKEKKVDQLKEYLDSIHSNFNFVGISKAFSDMEDSYNKERKFFAVSLFFSAILCLLPFIAAYYIYFGLSFGKESSVPQIISVSSLIGASELVLIYFFRVLLKNHQAAKMHIMQLRLRKSVCAFIEGYVKFRADNKTVQLEKFESLIFSGITPNEEKLPTTFDGLEQILGLIGKSETKK